MNYFHKIELRISAFLIMFSCLISLQAQKSAELGFIEGVNYEKGVVYKQVGNTKLIMDIFYPEPNKLKDRNPWMIYVHGGGWAGGKKENIFKKSFLGTLQTLLDSGVVCATIDYRLAKSPVTAFESVIDSKDAAKFLLKNAEQYKLDTIAYGVCGGSAGGHLSLLTALAPDSSFIGDANLVNYPLNFKCIASLFPLTSCVNPDLYSGSIFEDSTLFVRLLGGTIDKKKDLARLLSPTEHLKENSPPILLIHGDKDDILPIKNSEYMLEVAETKNAEVSLLTVKNGQHSFNGKNISPSLEGIADSCSTFILSNLREIKD